MSTGTKCTQHRWNLQDCKTGHSGSPTVPIPRCPCSQTIWRQDHHIAETMPDRNTSTSLPRHPHPSSPATPKPITMWSRLINSIRISRVAPSMTRIRQLTLRAQVWYPESRHPRLSIAASRSRVRNSGGLGMVNRGLQSRRSFCLPPATWDTNGVFGLHGLGRLQCGQCGVVVGRLARSCLLLDSLNKWNWYWK